MLSHEQVVELLPAYAVGCLDEAELTQVTTHLDACPDCLSELRAFQAVAAQLPHAIPQVDPPARVKEQLMRQAKAPAHPAVGQTNWWEKISGFFRSLSPAWSLASLAVIVLLVTSNLLLWQQVNTLQTQVGSGMAVVTLDGTEFAPAATGLIVVSLDGEHGTLVVDRLPQLSEEKQYQLWLIKDGQRTSGGVFDVSRDGYGSLWVSSEQPLAGFSAFGVTIEPAGGSPGPTGERVLAGAF